MHQLSIVFTLFILSYEPPLCLYYNQIHFRKEVKFMPSLKTYDLFISHAWLYGDDYDNLIIYDKNLPFTIEIILSKRKTISDIKQCF